MTAIAQNIATLIMKATRMPYEPAQELAAAILSIVRLADAIDEEQTAGMAKPDWSAEFPYHVERWTDDDQHIDQVVAMCAGIDVGKAAFEAAIAKEPGKHWTLRNRIRVIRRHTPS